jgi:Flp pilus assembly pilin Flp
MKKIKDFLREEDAIGTIEQILILVVLIGLAFIFRDQLTDLMNSIFNDMGNSAVNL